MAGHDSQSHPQRVHDEQESWYAEQQTHRAECKEQPGPPVNYTPALLSRRELQGDFTCFSLMSLPMKWEPRHKFLTAPIFSKVNVNCRAALTWKETITKEMAAQSEYEI